MKMGTDTRLRANPLIILAVSVICGAAWTEAGAGPLPAPSIDGTYELTKRVQPNGTVLRPPSVMALYTLSHGRFSLNLFFKNPDGTLASESTIGRYTFSQQTYCEWIVHTIRNNFGGPGVSNSAPVLAQHCAPVTSQNGRYRFSPPGEGLVMSVGAEGFEAKIDGGVTEYWTKVR